MVKVSDVLAVLEKIAPRQLAEEWDNPGLLVGSPRQGVRKIFVCLDVSHETVEAAIRREAQLIVAHHPLIFKPIKAVRTDRPLGLKLLNLLRREVAVIAAHTNWDSAVGGVNDILAEKIGLVDIRPFGAEPAGLGRIGCLSEGMFVRDFAQQVKKNLGAKHIRLVSFDDLATIKKIAVCGGSGADFIRKAHFLGCDALVTGDVRYHDAQEADELGIHVIDAGHFATEYPAVEVLAATLFAELNQRGVEVLCDRYAKDYFQTI